MRLADVAKAAGVHPGTVSRALNPETAHHLNADTVARVREVARELDYRVNGLAAGLRRSRSGLIGVVMRDFTNMMLPVMFRGIENRLRESGYMALLGTTYADPERKRDLYQTFLDRRVDGFVVTFADRDDADLAILRSDGIPLVLLNRATVTPGDLAILPDLEGGMRVVAEHLLKLGHRRIGYVAGPSNALTADRKLAALRAALASSGAPLDEAVVRRARLATDLDGEAAAHDLLAAHPELTAVACGNDLIALGTLRAATKLGRECPFDLSVVGFNDIPFLDRIAPALTSVAIPHYEMGYAAADAVVALIGNKPVAASLAFPCTLVPRASTGPVPNLAFTKLSG